VRENAVRSLTRAVLALGLNANDRRIYPTEYAGRTWPHDRDVPAALEGRGVARDGSLILSDGRAPTLAIVCETCGRRGRSNVES
jgi:hypothetical protein